MKLKYRIKLLAQFAGLLLILTFIFSCAGPVRYGPGLAVVRNEPVKPIPLPDSLRGVFRITIFEGKIKSSIICIVSAIPRLKYKMDFKGPLGTHLGSFLWVKDSLWCLFLPDEEAFFQGKDEKVTLPILNLDSIPISFLLEFLWGNALHGGTFEPGGQKGRFKSFRSLETSVVYRIDSKTGLIKECCFNSYALVFQDYTPINRRMAPRKCFLYQDGKLHLSIQIKSMKDNPKWKKTPFRLKLPKIYIPMPESKEETG